MVPAFTLVIGASRSRLSEIVKRPLTILRIAIRIAMTFRNNNVHRSSFKIVV